MFQYNLILFLWAATIFSLGLSPLEEKIIGGSLANIEEFPYQVSLQYKGRHFCGGSIIHPRYILTAAHCVDGQSAYNLNISAGSIYHVGGVTIKVCKIFQHHKYEDFDNDIAILQLCSNLSFNKNILPIALPKENVFIRPNTRGFASGWGAKNENGTVTLKLRKVMVPILAPETCKRGYSDYITKNMICAGYLTGGKDSCQGDSGGPLRAKGKLVGIVSWGSGCARVGYPGVYTNVAVYRNWIRNIVHV
ncbi:unnamed protein product [Brassicogethes aeneus]|uniref:Peptidase S1 domain-containing protein n=1 Tax=Brassicogethes aeneus TaxID=1431903 RepID=A0A9P0B0V2_BRAAE|nr:unnamed protein product [Brassicogethes aeneus]